MKSDKGVSVLSTFRFALLLCAMVFFLGACRAPKEPNNSAPTGEMSSSVGEETQEKSEAKEMPPTQTKLRLAALKGPTSMGMAYVVTHSFGEILADFLHSFFHAFCYFHSVGSR